MSIARADSPIRVILYVTGSINGSEAVEYVHNWQ